jgi:hypothetical protein
VEYSASAVDGLTGEVQAGAGVETHLGIGYGNVAGFGVNFCFDLGVAFTGSPKAKFNAVCGASPPSAQCAQLLFNVAVEAAERQRSVEKSNHSPVANIRGTIGF